MTRLSWGWGDYWGALCILVAIAAAKFGGLETWWIPLVLAGALGYFLLNLLQARVEDADTDEGIYDQDERR